MINSNDIGDEEFTQFFHSLGVETYHKSFEWLLCDPEFGDVLHWFYNNLDQCNALTAREECRYAEIENRGVIPSSEDLEKKILSIQQEYDGICFPGDEDALDDVKLDIRMLEESLAMQEKHERVLKDLISQNEIIKQNLDVEVIKLNAVQRQCEEDEDVSGEGCVKLAREVDTITGSVMDVVANTLKMYSNCCKDKEIAKRFLAFGPLNTYRQTQAMFRSRFDFFTSKKFDRIDSDVTDDDLQCALIEAKKLEERLLDATFAYIDSKTELSGLQAKIAFITNYSSHDVHPSQIASCLMDAQSDVELLGQEETMLEHQLADAANDLVHNRTSLAVDTVIGSALVLREQIHEELSLLLETAREALALDRLLHAALRHELRSVQQLLQFAAQLRACALDERHATAARLKAMAEISAECSSSELSLNLTDPLLNALRCILGADAADPVALVKNYRDMLTDVRELNETVSERFRSKQRSWRDYKDSTKALTSYIYDGCTRQPNCYNRSLASMAHGLRTELDRVDRVVAEASSRFQTVKNGDKRNLRKLWQWFLTDPARLLAAINSVQSRNYT